MIEETRTNSAIGTTSSAATGRSKLLGLVPQSVQGFDPYAPNASRPPAVASGLAARSVRSLLIAQAQTVLFARKFGTGSITILLLSVVLIGLTFIGNLPTDGEFFVWMLVKLLLAALFSYIVVFRSATVIERYAFLVNAATVTLPALVLLVIAITVVRPELALSITTPEETGVEALQPALLFLASLVFAVMGGRFIARNNFLVATTALLGAWFLFVCGMEEISWMQRMLGVESGEFFRTYNSQAETNVHNFASRVFNTAYHTAAFVLLIVLPYYHQDVTMFLTGTRLSFLTSLVPSHWIFFAFAGTVGLVNARNAGITPLIVIAVFTSVLLAKQASDHARRHNYERTMWLVSLMLLIGVSYMLGSVGPLRNEHAPIEHRETFVAIGLMVYAIDVYAKNFVFRIDEGVNILRPYARTSITTVKN